MSAHMSSSSKKTAVRSPSVLCTDCRLMAPANHLVKPLCFGTELLTRRSQIGGSIGASPRSRPIVIFSLDSKASLRVSRTLACSLVRSCFTLNRALVTWGGGQMLDAQLERGFQVVAQTLWLTELSLSRGAVKIE